MDTNDTAKAKAAAIRIIDALGGTAKAAVLCNTSLSAVSQWRTNGIPEPRLMYIKLARPDLFQIPKQSARRRATDPPSESGRAARSPPKAPD